MRNVALALALVIATPLFAQPSGSYRITHRYVLGGEGGWDYLVPDPPSHRLFIGRQNRVMVVDEDRGTLLGEITGIQGAHGTAIARAAGRGFATSGNDQQKAWLWDFLYNCENSSRKKALSNLLKHR